jgi:hypothetical protein
MRRIALLLISRSRIGLRLQALLHAHWHGGEQVFAPIASLGAAKFASFKAAESRAGFTDGLASS